MIARSHAEACLANGQHVCAIEYPNSAIHGQNIAVHPVNPENIMQILLEAVTMNVGVICESPGEAMVALTPDSVQRLSGMDIRVMVEAGAGVKAGWDDDLYRNAGASVVGRREEVIQESDLVVSVNGPGDLTRWRTVKPGTVLVGMLKPLSTLVEEFEGLAQLGVTALSLDSLPRISRAQSMDVLSSLSTVMGYRAAILAAERLRKFFPLLMTAAGTVTPARVLVLGAGVAGLQAIATAHRLGAIVEAFDTRPEVKEQVESLGASFLTLDVASEHTADGYATGLQEAAHRRETERLREPVARADAVITTAQIPGQRAPILITREMIAGMRPGSVIIDLAAESGGNTEVTRAGEEVDCDGVLVVGTEKLASQLPRDASQLYSRNLTNFLSYLRELPISWDADHRVVLTDDELVTRTTVVHDGAVIHPGLQRRLQERGALNVTHR